MTQAIADVLNRAADLLELPNAWTGPARSYAGALGADGEWRAAHSTEAVQWSIHAAIFRASGAENRRNGDLCNSAVLAIETHVPGYDADAWERVPGRTQAEVVEMVRSIALRAAAAAAGGGAPSGAAKSSDLIAMLDDPKIAAAVNESGGGRMA